MKDLYTPSLHFESCGTTSTVALACSFFKAGQNIAHITDRLHVLSVSCVPCEKATKDMKQVKNLFDMDRWKEICALAEYD